jgi:hypothetical protein
MVVSYTSRYPVGTKVFDRDWDVLIILDTCRVDSINSVSDEYDFIKTVDSIYSVGGSSPEWMAHTFDKQYQKQLSETAYITANGFGESILYQGINKDTEQVETQKEMKRLYKYGSWNTISADDLGSLDLVWKYYNDMEDYAGYHRPEYVTDSAIWHSRNTDVEKLIVHYAQPHKPYGANAVAQKRELYEHEINPFTSILRNKDLKDKVYKSYLHELKTVLNEVAKLINNIDKEKVVISADHGEAFGEFGVYEHHSGSLHPQIRKVPWIETSGTDKRQYIPKMGEYEKSNHDVNEVLESLGYK